MKGESLQKIGLATVLAVAGLVIALGSLGWAFSLQNRLATAQQSIMAATQQQLAK